MTIHRQSSPTNSVCPINGTPVPDTSDLSHPATVNHKLHYSYPSHQPTPVSAAPVPNDSHYDVPVALRKVPPPPPNPTKTHLGKDVAKLERMSNAVTTLLECLGEDPSREGLRNTPMRYAKALLALTHGYGQTAEEVVAGATFDEDHEEPVLVRDITLNSLCEHHILPFQGVCHISYIPRGRVLGLSKFARIVDVFSKRLQVQERLTKQIADAVERVTGAAGVMVMVSCSHECMSMRGVQRVGAVTTTTATRGRYGDEAALRQEFLSMVGARAS